jgi:hypothetical protein
MPTFKEPLEVQDRAIILSRTGLRLLLIDSEARQLRWAGRMTVGGIHSPHPAAVLDVSKSQKAIFLPLLTTAARNSLPNPQTGMLIYNVTTGQVEVYQAGAWQALGSGGGGSGIAVRKNNGTPTPYRSILNLLEGSNVTLNVVDDPSDGEIEITVSSGGGPSITFQEDGADLAARPKVNFGSGIVASDNSANNRTDVEADYGISADIQSVGSSNQAGSSPRVARADHVHALPPVLDSNARVAIRQSGTTIGTRRAINFLAGPNVALNISDDSTNEEVDVEISASGSGLTIYEDGTPLTPRGGLNFGDGVVASDDGVNNRTNVNIDYGSTAEVQPVSGSANAGTSLRLARIDHVHPVPNTLDSNARVQVKNNGAAVGTRRAINFIAGSNVTLSISDDASNEEVDVTISAVGSDPSTFILRGLLEDRPTPSMAGRLYWAYDVGVLYRDSGSAWQTYSDGLHHMVWVFSGPLAVTAGMIRLRPNQPGTILGVRCSAGTAPAGSSIIVDVKKNNSTIFPDSPKPNVPAGSNDGSLATPDVTSFSAGDIFTCNITQVGSSNPGSDLVVTLFWVI